MPLSDEPDLLAELDAAERIALGERFTHEVTAWTAGQLREALKDIPDGTPLRVSVAEEPGGDTCDEQVVFSAAPWNECFLIETEFPPGVYYRDPGE